MSDRLQSDLDRAKVLCHAGDLLGTYTLLKRYYDRVPFKMESEHTTYISMFVWTLCELGKDNDIRFYLDQIERHRERNESAELLYPLGVLYAFGKNADLNMSNSILSLALNKTTDESLEARIKMSLAFVYQRLGLPSKSVAELISSIPEVEDPYLNMSRDCWRAIVAYDAGDFEKAERIFKLLDKRFIEFPDWYLSFSVHVLRSCMHSKSGRRAEAQSYLERARTMLIGKNYRVAKKQLYAAEEYLRPQEVRNVSEKTTSRLERI